MFVTLGGRCPPDYIQKGWHRWSPTSALSSYFLVNSVRGQVHIPSYAAVRCAEVSRAEAIKTEGVIGCTEGFRLLGIAVLGCLGVFGSFVGCCSGGIHVLPVGPGQIAGITTIAIC